MGVRKYIKKQGRRAGKYLKKRYAPHGKIDIGKIAKDLAVVKSVLNVEHKYTDAAVSNTLVPAVGSVWNVTRLNAVDMGDFLYNRNGASVRFKSLQMKGSIKYTEGTVAKSPGRVRLVLFVDKEPLVSGLGVLPNTTDLWYTNSITGGGYVDSLRNYDGILQKRFTVLMDRTYSLNDDKPEVNFKIFKKLNMITKWGVGSTTGSSISNNALYLAFVGDQSALGEANQMYYAHISRMTYVDN